MGLIKTAMMSGAAMYGINKLAQTAQARSQANPPPAPPPSQRRGLPYEEEQYYVQPSDRQNRSVEYRDQRVQSRSPPPHEYSEREQVPRYYEGEPKQRTYYEDDYPIYDNSRYPPTPYDKRAQFPPSDNMRGSSAPPSYAREQRWQQGFVEDGESSDNLRGQQRGNTADVVNRLAQQAMSIGFVPGRDGHKSGGKSDLLSGWIGK